MCVLGRLRERKEEILGNIWLKISKNLQTWWCVLYRKVSESLWSRLNNYGLIWVGGFNLFLLNLLCAEITMRTITFSHFLFLTHWNNCKNNTNNTNSPLNANNSIISCGNLNQTCSFIKLVWIFNLKLNSIYKWRITLYISFQILHWRKKIIRTQHHWWWLCCVWNVYLIQMMTNVIDCVVNNHHWNENNKHNNHKWTKVEYLDLCELRWGDLSGHLPSVYNKRKLQMLKMNLSLSPIHSYFPILMDVSKC